MGFWGTLGKIGMVAGAGALTGLTGGAAAPLLMGAAGKVIGDMGAAATANRGAEANFAQQAMRDHENALVNRGHLELNQNQDLRTAEQDNYKKALMSALAMNMQDAKFDRSGFRSNVPNISFSGGARPSALGEQGREAASLLNNQALQRLMAGPQQPTELPALERAEIPKASIWERLAGPVGLGLSAAGAIADARQPQGLSSQAMPRPSGIVDNPSLWQNINFGGQ